MLRAHYDGSGKGEDPNSTAPFLTLAGILAYDNLWADLEAQWRALLTKHGMPYVHMRDLGALQKCFKGKRRDLAEFAVSEFVALISHLDPEMFTSYGCTVHLDDFRRAQRDYPAMLSREPGDICVNWCVGGFQDQLVVDFDNRVAGDNEFLIVFDHGEEFEGRIRRIYDAVRADEALLPSNRWVARVTSIIPLSSRDFPGLQAADVLAWNCNRHYMSRDREEWFTLAWRNWPNGHAYYDYDRIVSEYSTGVWAQPARGADQH
jgi:hypothetical protein